MSSFLFKITEIGHDRSWTWTQESLPQSSDSSCFSVVSAYQVIPLWTYMTLNTVFNKTKSAPKKQLLTCQSLLKSNQGPESRRKSTKWGRMVNGTIVHGVHDVHLTWRTSWHRIVQQQETLSFLKHWEILIQVRNMAFYGIQNWSWCSEPLAQWGQLNFLWLLNS